MTPDWIKQVWGTCPEWDLVEKLWGLQGWEGGLVVIHPTPITIIPIFVRTSWQMVPMHRALIVAGEAGQLPHFQCGWMADCHNCKEKHPASSLIDLRGDAAKEQILAAVDKAFEKSKEHQAKYAVWKAMTQS